MANVVVTGSFDDLRFRHVRLLEEAAALGDVHVLLWSDEVVEAIKKAPPKFPVAEREYFVQSLRYVKRVSIVRDPCDPDALRSAEEKTLGADSVLFTQQSSLGTQHSEESGSSAHLRHRRQSPQDTIAPARKKVLVTGCFDWLHTGHVRFFEEVSEIGDVYAVVGHDANIRLLKGPGHPMFSQDQRRYMVGAIRYVTQALVSTGSGWLDAEPEIEMIRPDIYAVNEDGDKPEKREFCRQKGIEYRVLKRLPKTGLTRRQSTALRGF